MEICWTCISLSHMLYFCMNMLEFVSTNQKNKKTNILESKKHFFVKLVKYSAILLNNF